MSTHDPATCTNGDHYGQCSGVTAGSLSKASSHTPGPWYLEEFQHGPTQIKDQTQNRVLADVRQWNGGQGKANARLIAAAPELLEALKAAIGFVGKVAADCDNNINPATAYLGTTAARWLGEMEDVIAKAEGRA